MSSAVAYVATPLSIAQTVYELIAAARRSIVLQMYLLAADGQMQMLREVPGSFPYADMIADWLIDKKRASPSVDVVVLLDSNTPDDLRLTRKKEPLVRQRLREGGVVVLNCNLFETDYDRQRWFPPSARFHGGYDDVSPEAFVAAQSKWQWWHNVEDHRKNLVIDQGRWAAITSHNFIDVASFWHENMFVCSGAAAADVWAGARQAIELALQIPQRAADDQASSLATLCAEEPGGPTPLSHLSLAPELVAFSPDRTPPAAPPAALVFHPCRADVLTNRDIEPAITRAIESCLAGDSIAIASTYFSDLDVLATLRAAAERGVDVRLLVDDVHALPLAPFYEWMLRHMVNRRFFVELAERGHPRLTVRVHRSGEAGMMHLKTAAFHGDSPRLIGGQANYTPNSFSGAWWETDISLQSPAIIASFMSQFEALWERSDELPSGQRGRAIGDHLWLGVLSALELVGLRP